MSCVATADTIQIDSDKHLVAMVTSVERRTVDRCYSFFGSLSPPSYNVRNPPYEDTILSGCNRNLKLSDKIVSFGILDFEVAEIMSRDTNTWQHLWVAW